MRVKSNASYDLNANFIFITVIFYLLSLRAWDLKCTWLIMPKIIASFAFLSNHFDITLITHLNESLKTSLISFVSQIFDFMKEKASQR